MPGVFCHYGFPPPRHSLDLPGEGLDVQPLRGDVVFSGVYPKHWSQTSPTPNLRFPLFTWGLGSSSGGSQRKQHNFSYASSYLSSSSTFGQMRLWFICPCLWQGMHWPLFRTPRPVDKQNNMAKSFQHSLHSSLHQGKHSQWVQSYRNMASKSFCHPWECFCPFSSLWQSTRSLFLFYHLLFFGFYYFCLTASNRFWETFHLIWVSYLQRANQLCSSFWCFEWLQFWSESLLADAAEMHPEVGADAFLCLMYFPFWHLWK